MFMFRSRRSNLSRRLLKLRRRPAGDETRRLAESVLCRLQDNQLEMMAAAVEGRGAEPSNCVLLPLDGQPHVLCCQLWRWPDVRQADELRRLPSCSSSGDPVYVCCNPYHWSRLCQPDSPPPAYTRCAVDRLKPEDRAPSEAPLLRRNTYSGSVTTNGEGSALNQKVWCQLAYWELAQRVGPLFPVEPTAMNVFGDILYEDGLSLKTLAQHSFSPPESVCGTRSKIGLGVTLSKEDDCVWVYNRSDNPVFVNSLTLDNSATHSPTRVPADHCLCVYDPSVHHSYGWDFASRYGGPLDPNSVCISFGKGWGAGYKRQEIKACPCWLEILLVPGR